MRARFGTFMVLRRIDLCVARGDLLGDLDLDFLMVGDLSGDLSGDFCSIDLSRSFAGDKRSIFFSDGISLSIVFSRVLSGDLGDLSLDLSFEVLRGDFDDLLRGDLDAGEASF